MVQYMIQFAYQPEAWAALVANPTDRSELVQGLAGKLGGRLISFHYTMGDWDGVAIIEAPDEGTAIAATLAVLAPGHLRATKMTRLIPVAEAMASMRTAQGLAFAGPAR